MQDRTHGLETSRNFGDPTFASPKRSALDFNQNILKDFYFSKRVKRKEKWTKMFRIRFLKKRNSREILLVNTVIPCYFDKDVLDFRMSRSRQHLQGRCHVMFSRLIMNQCQKLKRFLDFGRKKGHVDLHHGIRLLNSCRQFYTTFTRDSRTKTNRSFHDPGVKCT